MPVCTYISIVIPVFNSEKFLEKCLRSVFEQSYVYWECIIINDKSSDASQAIIDEWCERSDKFKSIINDSNLGPGKSRNKGIELAQGEYVTFLDSDDWLGVNYLLTFVKNNPVSSLLLVQDLNKYYHQHIETNTQQYAYETLELPEKLMDFLSNYKYTQGYVSCKLYHLGIIRSNTIEFPPDTSNEDEVFYHTYIKYISRIKFLANAEYNYLQHANSISRNQKFSHLLNYLLAKKELLAYVLDTIPDQAWGTLYCNKNFSSTVNYILNSIIISKSSSYEILVTLRRLSLILQDHRYDFETDYIIGPVKKIVVNALKRKHVILAFLVIFSKRIIRMRN